MRVALVANGYVLVEFQAKAIKEGSTMPSRSLRTG